MSLSVIIGCMFSGKTSELQKIARRNRNINRKVLIINHEKDKRYTSESKLMTHDLVGLECVNCHDLMSTDIIQSKAYKDADVICINEGQFYKNLTSFCNSAANIDSKHLHVCGLDGDYEQQPFGEMLSLIPMADSVIKLSAFCKGCNDGTLGVFTKRMTQSTDIILIGGSETYIPVCRKCLNK